MSFIHRPVGARAFVSRLRGAGSNECTWRKHCDANNCIYRWQYRYGWSSGDAAMTPTVSADGSTPAQAAGGTALIPETGARDVGAPDDLDELMRALRTAGATVELGDEVTQEFLSVSGQQIRINGEEVQIFMYASAELLERQASQIPDDGNAENEPQFYKLGNMLVRYVGRDPGVRDLLEDVLGARAADRQASPTNTQNWATDPGAFANHAGCIRAHATVALLRFSKYHSSFLELGN